MVNWTKFWSAARAHWLMITIWAGTLLIVNWTLLTRPIFYTHDYLHGGRIAEYARGLLEGQWPVIWSQNFGFGFGMPLFEFYAPLPYAIGAIFYLLGANLVWATKLTYLTANIFTMVGMYYWARQFFDRDVSSLAAALLTLASYRAMDIFVRGAMSEIWAIGAVGWLLAGLTQLARGRDSGFWGALVGGVTLCLSHNITTLLVVPIAGFYALILWLWPARPLASSTPAPDWSTLGKLALTALAIGGASAFYLVPALAEKNLTQIETWILGDYFDYHLHFLYTRQFFRDNFGYGGSGWGPDDGISFFLGYAQLLGLAGSLLVAGEMIYRLWTSRPSTHNRQNLYKLVIFTCVFVLFMWTIYLSLFKSQWLWDSLSDWLAFVQFPWRALGIGISLLAWLAVWGISQSAPRYRSALIIGLWLLLAATSAHYFRGDNYLDEPAFYQSDPDFIRTTLSPILVDYLPRDFKNIVLNHKGEFDWVSVSSGTPVLGQDDQPTVVVERMHEKLYTFTREASGSLELAIANYPGWQAEINGRPADIATSERGNIVLELPAGESQVGLKLRPSPVRGWANAVSCLTWLLITSYVLGQVCPKKHP